MSTEFTHLHVHTEYSMLDGAARLGDLFAATAELVNTAYLVVGSTLHTVALDTGAATAVGALAIDGTIRDIAILP